MKITIFSAKPYDQKFLEEANATYQHELIFLAPHLNQTTASLAEGASAVCVFVNDTVDVEVLEILARQGIRVVALRCAGFNNVDLKAAATFGIKVVRVPAYSPYAVAEHTMALLLALNRKIHRAYNRVREGNFALDGLLGFDIHGQTVGLIGAGRIGLETARLFKGFGCRVLAYDPVVNPECEALGVEYTSLSELFTKSDIVTLHCPLTPDTHHLINSKALAQMKDGVILLNTSRGALLDSLAVIAALKSRKIGYLGIDVYEEEGDLFFEDLSNEIIQDDVFARLTTFPNVMITPHQAFFTSNALENIAQTTLQNVRLVERGESCPNEVFM